MLSILIPIFNYNVVKLIADLQEQASALSIDFEIIAIEDGSHLFLDENKKTAGLAGVKYLVQTDNSGRSKLRNRLADMAKYPCLLFIDCDAEIADNQFIKNYLPYCTGRNVVVGGTAYSQDEKNSEYSLRLLYGRKRESYDAVIQLEKANFTTFNFLIPKELFHKIRFNESISGYGCEDMLFGFELKKMGRNYIFINNQLIHKGLDTNQVFLEKAKNAIKNLYMLYISGNFPDLCSESKLLASCLKLQKFRLIWLYRLFFYLFKTPFKWNLSGKKPVLFIFDLWKLGVICNLQSTLLPNTDNMTARTAVREEKTLP
jgi:glycosyltransferase involved in cell wall biosynthesis